MRERRLRLTTAAALAVALVLGATVARADCDKYWDSCDVLDGAALVIRQPAMPQLGRITIGEDEVSGFGIGVSVGYRIARLVLTADLLGIYHDDLDMNRAGLSAQYILVHLPTR